MVNLVGHDRDCVALAPADDLAELRIAQHGSGRVRRAGDDEPVDRAERFERRERRLEVVLDRRHEGNDFDSDRLERVAVAGVARHGHGNSLADVECGEEREREPTRGASRDHDVVGIDIDAVPVVVVTSELLAQLHDALGARVPEPVSVERAVCGLDHAPRGRGRRLSDFEPNDLGASSSPTFGLVEDLHHVEGGNVGSAGQRDGHGASGSYGRSATAPVTA